MCLFLDLLIGLVSVSFLLVTAGVVDVLERVEIIVSEVVVYVARVVVLVVVDVAYFRNG